MGNWREYQTDGDIPFFLKGLRTFVESQGGVTELSKRTGIDTETLLDTLSNKNAPRLDMLRTILNALECQLSVELMVDANVSIEPADVDYQIVPR